MFFSWFLGGTFCGKFGGKFRGFFQTHQNKGSKFSGEISEHFSWEISCLENKIFRASFVLQTCHPNNPEGPKIKKIRDFERDWKFRASMKFSSEPPTAALFLWGNRDVEIEVFDRDLKIRLRLKISIGIEFLLIVGPSGKFPNRNFTM